MGRSAGALTLLILGACASPEPRSQSVDPAPPARSSIERATDPASGVTSVVLTPSPVPTLGPSDLHVRSLSVGAQFASRPLPGKQTRDAYGLVFVTVANQSRPIFERDRRLLLDIDGQLFTSVQNPAGLNSLYGAHQTEAGIEERIVIPVGAAVIHSLADAGRVKGRLGSWVMFELEGDRLQRFSELSRLLPPQTRGTSEPAPDTGDRTGVAPIGS